MRIYFKEHKIKVRTSGAPSSPCRRAQPSPRTTSTPKRPPARPPPPDAALAASDRRIQFVSCVLRGRPAPPLVTRVHTNAVRLTVPSRRGRDRGTSCELCNSFAHLRVRLCWQTHSDVNARRASIF
ncbi:hypothetical protein EVAR_53211_1 [Eumeta japonica]|uniref:Uncharacterized protein n=1 Tax=Eumeta variegata TaxID=151549 RepID=A0A4C1XCZ0_EUMVA|nr:hypothetical protein EVAR_53211_1 [Eumeta japonica]